MRKTFVWAVALVVLQVPLVGFTLLQERTWGGPNDDEGAAVAVAPDGSVYLTGTTQSFGKGNRDAFLVRYSDSGRLLWQRTYGTAPDDLSNGDEFGLGVAVAPNGSAAYITGQARGGNVFLARFSESGSLVWQKTWGDNGNSPRAVAVDDHGSVYVAGFTFTYGEGGDAFLVKFSPAGRLIWQRTWGGPGFEIAHDVAIGADGSIYMTGEANSFLANDAFLVKFNTRGDLVWERDWATRRPGAPEGVFGLTAAFGVGTGKDGSVYITGNAFEIGALRNIILVKFDEDGSLVWDTIGGPGFGAGQDVAVGAAGSVFVTGSIIPDDPNAFSSDAFIARFTADGRARRARVWGGVDSESGESIAVAPYGDIVIGGSAGAPPYSFDRVRNSAGDVDSVLIVPVGMVTDPGAHPEEGEARVTRPRGSQEYGGGSDAMMLRIERRR